jgi:hypothetical protein
MIGETELTATEFGWMLMGLQRYGVHSLEYPMIGPFTMAFGIELRGVLSRQREGDGHKIKKHDLDRITACARDHARSLVFPMGSRAREDNEARASQPAPNGTLARDD